MRRLFCVALMVAAASCAGTPTTQEHATPACTPPATDPALALRLLQARVVLVGTPQVDAQKLTAEAARDRPDYIAIPVDVAEIIKGDAAAPVAVMHYPRDAPYQPSNAALAARSGQKSLLFLQIAADGAGRQQFYFVRADSLSDGTSEAVISVKSEMAREAKLLKSWSRNESLPHYREVEALIRTLASIEKGPRDHDSQQAVFRQIEALGEEAVPAIVAQMDDRRALAQPQISLANHAPDAFESIRHYVVYSIGDALVAILAQITGQYFDSYNRLTDAALGGWRIYAADLECKGV